MADLIYKSDLLADYQQDLCGHIPCHECPFLVSNGHDSTECSLERYISEQPTVDAETVRHGQWIVLPRHGQWRVLQVNEYDLEYGRRVYEPVYECSACGCATESYIRWDEPVMPQDADFPEYCQHCGAKMDEVKE